MDLEAKKDAHRVSRRQNRGRWHSGGFDLSSAIAGAAKAGAMNMATVAAHMAFNGVAKIGSSIGAEMKCSNIFNNARTYGSLEQGVRSSVLSLAYGYAQCLAEHGDRSILSGFPSIKDRQTAIMMMNNANTLSPHDPKAEIILQQAFQNDPYCDKIYEYLLNHHRNDKHLPPVFGRKKRGSTFQSSPRGKFLLSSPRYKNTARSLVWAVFCVRLAVYDLS